MPEEDLERRNAAWAMTALGMGAVAIPWIHAIAPGPAPSVVPWLIAAACTVVLWLASPALRVPGPVVAAAVVLSLAMLRSAGLTPEAVVGAGSCLLIAVCAGVAAAQREREAFVRLLCIAWLVAALLNALMALVQYFDLAAHFGGLVSIPSTPEAYGNLRQRNQFAALTAIGLLALFWLAGRSLPLRLAVPAAVLLAVANAASVSRTGTVQLVAVMAFALLWPAPQRRRPWVLCAAALTAYLVAVPALPRLQLALAGVQGTSVVERFVSDLGCSSRVVLWSNVGDLIAQRPMLGWGWGELDFAHFHHLYPGARFCDILDNAHNLPLHLAVELGLPVALLASAALAWLLLARAPWREQDPVRQLAWALLVLLLLHSAVEYPLWYGPFQMAFGLALGLLLAPRAAAPGQARAWSLLGAGRPLAAAAALLLGYAAWDYQRVSQIYLSQEDRHPAWREDTLEKAGASFLFANQARFAELTTVPLSHANAPLMHALAVRMLHYSPEPRVIEKAVETAVMLDRPDEALLDLARYRAAFPDAYQEWRRSQGLAPVLAPASAPARVRD